MGKSGEGHATPVRVVRGLSYWGSQVTLPQVALSRKMGPSGGARRPIDEAQSYRQPPQVGLARALRSRTDSPSRGSYPGLDQRYRVVLPVRGRWARYR